MEHDISLREEKVKQEYASQIGELDTLATSLKAQNSSLFEELQYLSLMKEEVYKFEEVNKVVPPI